MRDFIGINGHTVQFRPTLYRPVASHVRDYHPVAWDLGNDTSTLPEFPVAKNRVDWSKIYGEWHRDGWRIDVSLMFESIPRGDWKEVAKDARAYGEAFARTFGPSGRHPFVETAEIGNEPGKWSDEEFSTLSRAMAEGIRAGDPKLKIATCNLTTGASGDYEKSVTCFAELLDLFDVLTIHTYPMVEGWPTWRRSFPEDVRLKDYLSSVERLCEWRDAHAAGKPVWITEFGYDSSTKSPARGGTFEKWEDVTDEQHAQWLVRSLLLFSVMPIERAYIYFFNDSDEPAFHASSGLTRNFEPKPAFHAVAHLQHVLGEFRFSRVVESNADVRIYEYESEDEIAWAIWSPTGDGRTVQWMLREMPGPLSLFTRMPTDKRFVVHRAPAGLDRIPAPWEIEVTESPLYVVFKRP